MKEKFLENLIKNAYYNHYGLLTDIEKVVINEITDEDVVATIYETSDSTLYIGKMVYKTDETFTYECIERLDRE